MSKKQRPAAVGLSSSLAGLGDLSSLLDRDLEVSTPAGAEKSEAAPKYPIAQIHPDPEQPRRRFDDGALQELADSIREQGVIQPIVIQPHPDLAGEWYIVAGERRWRASKMAGLNEIPAVVTRKTRREVVAAQLIENIQREDLNPLELAMTYARLQTEFSLTAEAVGKAIGKKKQTVSDYLAVLEMPEHFQAALERGVVRGVSDLNELWRLNKTYGQAVAALLDAATPESPVTRVMIRAIPKAAVGASAPAATSSNDGKQSHREGHAPTARDGGKPEGGDAGAANAAGSSGQGLSEHGGTGTSTGSGVQDGRPKGNPGEGGPSSKTPPPPELAYSISSAAKNGDWVATVRSGQDRIYTTPPFPTPIAAVGEAARWLHEYAQHPPAE